MDFNLYNRLFVRMCAIVSVWNNFALTVLLLLLFESVTGTHTHTVSQTRSAQFTFFCFGFFYSQEKTHEFFPSIRTIVFTIKIGKKTVKSKLKNEEKACTRFCFAQFVYQIAPILSRYWCVSVARTMSPKTTIFCFVLFGCNFHSFSSVTDKKSTKTVKQIENRGKKRTFSLEWYLFDSLQSCRSSKTKKSSRARSVWKGRQADRQTHKERRARRRVEKSCTLNWMEKKRIIHIHGYDAIRERNGNQTIAEERKKRTNFSCIRNFLSKLNWISNSIWMRHFGDCFSHFFPLFRTKFHLIALL